MTDAYSRIQQKAIAAHIPLNLDWELTWRCNERCKHCFQCQAHDARGEVTLAEIERTLDALAAMGTLFITFTGGEVLLREDIFEILAAAKKRGFAFRLFTNGLLLDDAAVAALVKTPPLSVDISVYALDGVKHDAVTGVLGSHAKSLAAAYRAKKAGLFVKLKFTFMADTADELPKLRAFAEQEGFGFTYYLSVISKVDGDASVCGLNADAGAVRTLFEDPRFRPSSTDCLAERRIPLCAAGLNTLFISPYGDLFPCVMLRHQCGNIRRSDIAKIWHEAPALRRLRALKPADLKKCADCEESSFCSRCMGAVELETGDFTGVSDRACMLARLRKEVAIDRSLFPRDNR
jgi:radical SAM protein with 4Fe4S-binding SPASM domain